ncbi:MAG TPA: polyprenyl synthetase family protein [Actinomycetota bacterium]|nr:polyprenyl synthetase family protein [Actinomycetota bacterium]
MPQQARSLEHLRANFDDLLDAYLDDRRDSLPDAKELIEEIRRALAAGGKRLRPALCYWGYRAAGGEPNEPILRAAASLELLHTFAVVHDDIMDAGLERRGQPTTVALLGIETAILVGDLALVLADDLFFTSGFGSSDVTRAFGAYSRMRQEVIAGQSLDVDLSRSAREITLDEALHVARLKSGRYSVEEPLAIGALLAGAGTNLLEPLEEVGRPFGLAFQINDDLMGSFGPHELIGKPSDADIRQGKRNVLYALALEHLQAEARSDFIGQWGARDLNEAGVANLRATLEACDARAEAERMRNDFRAEALRAVDSLPSDAETRAALGELIEFATSS